MYIIIVLLVQSWPVTQLRVKKTGKIKLANMLIYLFMVYLKIRCQKISLYNVEFSNDSRQWITEEVEANVL